MMWSENTRHSSFFPLKICIISKNCAKGHAIHRWKALFFYIKMVEPEKKFSSPFGEKGPFLKVVIF